MRLRFSKSKYILSSMTQEDLELLRSYAKKIAIVFYQKAIQTLLGKRAALLLKPANVLHLPFGSVKKIKEINSEEFHTLFQEVSKKVGPVRISV